MRSSELTDEAATLAAAQAGDRDAFGALVQPHLAMLRSLPYRMLTSREDAGDAVQEGRCAP